jgi:hypothetical protein
MSHGHDRKLGIHFVFVGDKGDTTRVEDPYPFDFAPFGEMPCDDFFNVVGDVNATNVEREVLAHEGSYTAHVVAVVGVFVAAKTVDVGGEHVVDHGEAMEVGTRVAIGTHASSKEEAKVRARYAVCTGIPRIFGDVAPCFRMPIKWQRKISPRSPASPTEWENNRVIAGAVVDETTPIDVYNACLGNGPFDRFERHGYGLPETTTAIIMPI